MIKKSIFPLLNSNPNDNGVTSNKINFSNPGSSTLLVIAPWIAAPIATASSGCTFLEGSLLKYSFTICCIFGIRVEPPTNTISSIWFLSNLASFKAVSTIGRVLSKRLLHISWNSGLAIVIWKSSPSAKASRSKVTSSCVDKFFLIFSHSLFNLLIAFWFLEISFPVSSLNSLIQCSTKALSKSSPPKCISPQVDFTSKIVPSIWRIVTSKVPPPKSNIKTFLGALFSSLINP